ncbi:MAG: hypothetical protein IPH17_01235 [Bacteroidales bacterium]|nr:hypothetical protein [Bacteroidales bacterium]
MKKIILINLIILLSLSKIYSQDKTFLSTEFNTNYFYYFLGENNNKFNYGFSLQLSENIDKFKISFGAIYATKYYWDKPSEKYNKCEYLLKNIRLQIIGNYQIISKNTFSMDILGGFDFDQIIDYDVKLYYVNGYREKINNIKIQNKLGVSCVMGLNFSKLISDRVALNLSPKFYITIKQDHKTI